MFKSSRCNRSILLGLALSCIALPLHGALQSSQAAVVCEQETWSGTSYTGVAFFGFSLAISGNTALVGVPDNYQVFVPLPGEAHVFERSGGVWSYGGPLASPGVKWGDLFGSVALDGNWAAVGAAGDDEKARDAGAVYLYERVLGTWGRRGKVWANNPRPNGYFGYRLRLSGSRFIAIQATPGASQPNSSVIVFARQGTAWVQEAELIASGTPTYSTFGLSFDIDGDTVVIGDDLDTTLGMGRGAAYVFVRTPTGWAQQAKLGAAPWGTYFGISIAVDRDTLVVGDDLTSLPGSGSGAVFVFDRSQGSWAQTAVLVPKNPVWYFGYEVSIEADRIVVAAGESVVGSYPKPRWGYVFERVGGTWVETSIPVDITACAISGNTVLFGEDQSSVVHNYLLHAPLASYCTAKTNSLGCLPSISFAGCPKASATSGFRIQATNVRNNKPGVLLYGLGGRNAVPFYGGTLCLATPVLRTPVVDSGGWPAPYNSCSGVFDLDMSAFASGALGGTPSPLLRQVGTLVNCQWWGRDFGASFAVTLSDALEYTVIP